jgi:hypothetical protein
MKRVVIAIAMMFGLGTATAFSQHVGVGGMPNGNAHEHVPPSGPAAAPNADYPLKVHLLITSRHQGKAEQRTDGSGNLLGEPEVGFDYRANCLLLHNDHHDEFYQGKWKKQDKKIEVLAQQPGETRIDKCELDVTLKAQPYTKENPAPKPPDAK